MFATCKIDLGLVHEQIDTTSLGGRLFFKIISAIAEFECDIIVDWAMAEMQSAWRAAIRIGRRFVMTPEKWLEGCLR